MDDNTWDAIQKAYDFVKSGAGDRVDNKSKGFLIYRAGTIIRIDIKVEDGK